MFPRNTAGLSVGEGGAVPLVCSVVVSELPMHVRKKLNASTPESDRHWLPFRPILIVHPPVGPPSIIRTKYRHSTVFEQN